MDNFFCSFGWALLVPLTVAVGNLAYVVANIGSGKPLPPLSGRVMTIRLIVSVVLAAALGWFGFAFNNHRNKASIERAPQPLVLDEGGK